MRPTHAKAASGSEGRASMAVWVVRPAGEEAAKRQESATGGCCIAGWDELTDFRSFHDEDAIKTAIKDRHPSKNNMGLSGWSGQILRFRDGIQPGDIVVMPVGGGRGDLQVGTVEGAYDYRPAVPGGRHRHLRPVRWCGTLPKAKVAEEAKGSIGAFLSVYRVDKPRFEKQLRAIVEGATLAGRSASAARPA